MPAGQALDTRVPGVVVPCCSLREVALARSIFQPTAGLAETAPAMLQGFLRSGSGTGAAKQPHPRSCLPAAESWRVPGRPFGLGDPGGACTAVPAALDLSFPIRRRQCPGTG